MTTNAPGVAPTADSAMIAASVSAARIRGYRDALTPRQALILTLHGEARGETPDGQIAIAQLIEARRRAGKWGATWADVVFARSQFSCWWLFGGRANAEALYELADAWVAHPDLMPAALELQQWIVDGLRLWPDLIHGANHYLTRALYASASAPAWAKSGAVVATVGNHYFLKV